ncbi:MAG TPA: hypothetical protein VFE60_23315 [Roseiarcus sp.]|nr:hypothetical protein [Roseiarcus sp.]
MRADGGVVGPQVEHLERLVVGQNETAARVQHAKAMRHVVEGHVEARREHCGLLLRRHHRHEVCSQPLRIGLHVKDERGDPHCDSHRIPTAGDDHRRRQRSERPEKLEIDSAVDRVAARHQAERVSGRHRHAEEMRKIIVGHAERKQGP